MGKTLQTKVPIFYSDPGHGWLKVLKADVVALGVAISPYSYEDGVNAYLEEDLDAPTFIEAAKAQGFDVPPIRDKYVNHFSHNRQRYQNPIHLKWVSRFADSIYGK